MRKAVPYYRVSTARQGESGLGLEAQRQNVLHYAAARELCLDREFVEIESTRKAKRPVLDEALKYCGMTGALLLIAKLDRLGRNVAFIARLMESHVDFIAVDNPNASKFMVQILAIFAEYERDQISQRTKDSLQAAKRRGVILGKYGATVLAPRNKFAARAFAASLQPKIQELQAKGFSTVRALQKQLNRNGVPTFRGGKAYWHINTVHRLLKQIEKNR